MLVAVARDGRTSSRGISLGDCGDQRRVGARPLPSPRLGRTTARRTGLDDDLEVVVDRSWRARGNGDFRTPGFDQHVFNKLNRIARWAEREPGPFLVTDVDVIYVRPFAAVVLDLLDGKDLLLAPEFPGRVDQYNIGQMVIRPSRHTADFFRRVADDLRRGLADDGGAQRAANQDYLDRALRATTLRHGALPETFANTGIWETLDADRRNRIHAYHATKTLPSPGRTSLEQKHERLSEVARACDLEFARS